MSRQRRRTADDFVRDMKAKQHHSADADIERKTSEGLTPKQAGAWRATSAPATAAAVVALPNRPKLLAKT